MAPEPLMPSYNGLVSRKVINSFQMVDGTSNIDELRHNTMCCQMDTKRMVPGHMLLP